MTSLYDIKDGTQVRVRELKGGDTFRRKLESVNIRPGKVLRKVVREPLSGPVIVEVDRTKLAIGIGMSSRILVEKV